ncbi:MAG: T9SS type A sorting domain-containing protein, partial [Bacteroidales bacterium]|nr:T9SS type A sorting domain-containing protein [Bacteroidales bacterium]
TDIPLSKLEVTGMIHSTSEGIKFPDGTIQATAAYGSGDNYWNLSDSNLYYNDGNIGIGTDEPGAKVEIADGDIFISDINRGIIMKSPDGNCWRGTLDNSGSLVFAVIDCPGEIQYPTLKSESLTNSITIYPNPVEKTVTIASLNGNLRNTIAILYTMDGKVVRKDELNSDYTILNMNNIPSGSYIISVVDKKRKELVSETMIKE